MTETAKRVAVAAVGIPLAVAVVVAGRWVLAAALVLIVGLGVREFYHMAEQRQERPLLRVGTGVAVAFVAAAALWPAAGPAVFGPLVAVAFLVISTVAVWAVDLEHHPLTSISTTLTGAIYTGALLSFGIFLRHLPGAESAAQGVALVFLPVVLTWASDTFAWLVGRNWGRHKLIPRVSPGKTVEGAIGAVVASVVVGAAYTLLLQPFDSYRPNPLQGAFFGLLVSVAAQVGDLVESLFKRDMGVKDSGTLLPGHGGVLDRFDSLLFTLPLTYLFLRYVVGPDGVLP